MLLFSLSCLALLSVGGATELSVSLEHASDADGRSFVYVSNDNNGCSLSLYLPATTDLQSSGKWTDDLKKEIAELINPCVDIRRVDKRFANGGEMVGGIPAVVNPGRFSDLIICKLGRSRKMKAFAQYTHSRWAPNPVGKIPSDSHAFCEVLLHRAILLYRLLKSKAITVPSRMDEFLGRPAPRAK